MGFFKSVLGDAVGGILGDAVSDKLNNATKAAAGAAVAATAAGAIGSLFGKKKNNPLEVAPPPPVPAAQEAMSVMVAVNGESYGPYERATLLSMINNGSLTRETLVFIQGMDKWQPASQVPKVAELFALNAPAPAAPPVPWASAPATPAQTIQTPQTAATDNTLSPRLNALITAAVADGEISDLERQVLIRNAQQENVSMDEFVMVLEARLFEQQQVLRAQQEESKRKDMAAKNQASAPQPHLSSASSAPKAMTKCPHCGAPVKALSTSCPECGNDYIYTGHTLSAWEGLLAKLEELDRKEFKKSGWMDDEPETKRDRAKEELISNYPIPGDKSGLLDFFTNCVPLSKSSFFGSENEFKDTYKRKSQQVLIKARILLKDDKDLLDQIEAIAKQYKIKA